MYFSMIPNPLRAIRYPRIFWEFYVNNFIKIAIAKFLKKNYRLERAEKSGVAIGREFLSAEKWNESVKEKILGNEPLFVCRYGNSELSACFVSELREKDIITNISDKKLQTAKSGPGVFPKAEATYLSFAKVYREALEQADINVYWGDILMEEYLLRKYTSKKCTMMRMRALEPFQYEKPWTAALKGKKVLIVHPFSELIESQYERRERLFDNPDAILPEFELKTVKAVQSSGDTVPNGIADWNEAMESMLEKIRATDFDVALLGCGSYAVPLGAEIKKMGKKAIILGGMMQLMFGIKGERWEKSRPDIVALYNDYWVRADAYRVKNADRMVDGAAYW